MTSIKSYLSGSLLLSLAGIIFYYALTMRGPVLTIVAVCFGGPAIIGGLAKSYQFLRGSLNLQPRGNYHWQQQPGRNVQFTAHGKTRWLSLQSIAPLFGFKPQSQSMTMAWQRELETWQWCAVPTCYSQKPEVITEAYIAKMAQWIFNRQQEDATKSDAASRPAWCREVDARQGAYWAALGLLMAGGAVREWGRSKIITCTPNRAVNRVKLACPTDIIIYV